MKVRQLFDTYMVIEADEGCYLQRKDIGWQRGDMFIVHKSAIRFFQEVEKPVVRDGQLLFYFMGG